MIEELLAIAVFILVSCPHGSLISIKIIRGSRNSGFKARQGYQIGPNHANLSNRQIIDAVFKQPINLKKPPRRKARWRPAVSGVTTMPPRIDLFVVCQRRQILDPSPWVNITEPLPDPRMAAQYETSGPHRSKILLLGKIGVSPVVACTVRSEPNRTNAKDEEAFVISTASPLPAS